MKGAGIRADLRFSRFQRAALKSEARNPKSEGNPKSEIRRAWWRLDLFGFRVSDFGFRQILTDFRSPLPFVLHELALPAPTHVSCRAPDKICELGSAAPGVCLQTHSCRVAGPA